MPAMRLNCPFQCLMASSEDITASHSLSVLRKRYFGLGSFSSTPSWVVPSQKMVSARASSTTGPERQPNAGRDDALHAIDLLLLHQLLEALDGVLGVGLLVDDELDLAAGDAAGGVEALDRPLGGAQAAHAGARSNAGARRQDADPDGLGLGDGGREDAGRGGGGAGGGDRFQQGAAG